MDEYRLDHIGLAETGRNWSRLSEDDRIQYRFRGHFPTHGTALTPAWNRHDTSIRSYQIGGTCSFTHGKLIGHLAERGVDPSGLGRWSWQRFRGKGTATVRIITGYRPVLGKKEGFSAYAQHLRWFMSQMKIRCPRDAFLEDLANCIDDWRRQGDQIIFMGDVNQFIRSKEIRKYFAQRGMREVITERHKRGPATTRSNQSGEAVDGIWMTWGLTVEAAGYLPFHTGPRSDHRVLWCQLSHVTLFGSKAKPFPRIGLRRLRLDDVRSTTKYTKSMISSYELMGHVDRRARDLFEQLTPGGPFTDSMRKEFHSLVHQRHKARKVADRHCNRLHTSAVASSPVMKKAQLSLQLVQKIIDRRSGKSVSAKTICKLAQKVNRQSWAHLPREKLLQLKRRCQMEYRRLKAKARPTRMTYLQSKVAAARARGDEDTAKGVHAQIQTERAREKGQRVRAINPKYRRNPVDRLTEIVNDPSAPGGQRIVEATTKSEVEDLALREVAARSRKSELTPPMVDPLLSKLGFLGTTPFCQDVLAGKVEDIPELGEHTMDYLLHCKALAEEPPSPAGPIPMDLYDSSIRRLRERTTSGASGITPAMVKQESKHPMLKMVDYHLACVPWMTGEPSPIWLQALDLLIYKKPNVIEAAKMRPILLFDIENNNHNKMLGRFAMNKAEEENGIAWEQYGSRRGKSADLQALNARLSMDIVRMRKVKCVDTFVDLVSNYDLVVHSIASLAMQRVGVPKEPIVACFATLQDMVHHCRTAFGDSSSKYGGKKLWGIRLKPPQGLGQGNGAAPTIWVLVSSPLFDMMRDKGHGAIFECSISDDVVHLTGFGFVDDTRLISVAPSPDWTLPMAMDRAQEGLDIFCNGAAATGGESGPAKMACCVIDFAFRPNGEAYYVDGPGTVYVETKSGRQAIKRLKASTAQEILGVFMAPDGNNKDLKKELRKKTQEWADRVRSGHVRQDEAWYLLQATITKGVQYPLTATTLTEADCRYIEAPALRQGLKSAGLPSNLPRAIVLAPDQYLGFAHGATYQTQQHRQLLTLITHGQSDDITGRLVRILITDHKVETGLFGDLFSQPYEVLAKAVTPTWISSAWKYMRSRNFHLGETTKSLAPQREKDDSLMSCFIAAGFKGKRLAQLNRCRIFLQVTTISDVVDGSGTHLLSGVLDGTFKPGVKSRYKWAVQGSPAPMYWKIWGAAVRKALDLERWDSLPPSKRLGKWLPEAQAQPFRYDASLDLLYKKMGNSWEVFTKTGRRQRTGSKFQPTGAQGTPSPDSHEAVCLPGNQGEVYLRGSVERLSKSSDDPAPGSFLDQCRHSRSQTSWVTSAVRIVDVSSGEEVPEDDGKYVMNAIRDGTAIAVSDGSTKDDIGSAAFVIEGPQYGRFRIVGDCMVPGYAGDQDSYRAELTGIYAVVSIVNILCKRYKVEEGSILMACDGLSAIRKALDKDSTISARSSQFDILFAIDTMVRRSPITWRWRHVDGHADDRKIFPLDRWQQLNVEVDALAKLRWQRSAPSHVPFHDIEGENWPLRLGVFIPGPAAHSTISSGYKVANRLVATLSDATLGERAIRYWENKPWIGGSAVRHINWEAIGIARNALSSKMYRWTSKFISGHAASQTRLFQRNAVQSPACLRCEGTEETSHHVLQCPDSDERWTEAFQRVRQSAAEITAPEGMLSLILDGIEAWRNNEPQPPVPPGLWRRRLTEAMRVQSEIGWGAALFGFLAQEWEEIQAAYLRSLGSRKSPRQWVTALISKLWDVSWDMWSYRTYQISQQKDEEVEEAVDALFRRIEWHVTQVTSTEQRWTLPSVAQPLVLAPRSRLPSDVDGALLWLETIMVARQLGVGGTTLSYDADPDRHILLKFRRGGILKRLRRAKTPPRLRTTSTMLVPKVLETISREWDDECPDLLLPDDPDHLLQWAPAPSPQQS